MVICFKISTAPLFIEKVRDVVGLYSNPPDKALVPIQWWQHTYVGSWVLDVFCVISGPLAFSLVKSRCAQANSNASTPNPAIDPCRSNRRIMPLAKPLLSGVSEATGFYYLRTAQ
jgi:hypothetical protein